MSPNRHIARLMRSLKPAEARKFAHHAGTSVVYLRHIGTGRRGISCDMAWRLSEAADKIGLVIPQTDLCEACRRHA
jgi:hypothetical protein